VATTHARNGTNGHARRIAMPDFPASPGSVTITEPDGSIFDADRSEADRPEPCQAAQDQVAEIFRRLAEPFDPSLIKVRRGPKGDMKYVTARTCRARLNPVLGPQNWGHFALISTNRAGMPCRIALYR